MSSKLHTRKIIRRNLDFHGGTRSVMLRYCVNYLDRSEMKGLRYYYLHLEVAEGDYVLILSLV